MSDKELIPYFIQVPDLELARQKQTAQDLEDLAKYRALKLQAYKDWSASMGKEFTYYDEKGNLVKVDVLAKREAAKAAQDQMAGTEIGPQYTVRKAYREYLQSGGAQLSAAYRQPYKVLPNPPPVKYTWFERLCLFAQSCVRRFKNHAN